jgi:hypothetical protein
MLHHEKNGRKSHEKIFYVQRDLYEQELQFINELRGCGIGLFEVKKKRKKRKTEMRVKIKKKNLFGIQQLEKY